MLRLTNRVHLIASPETRTPLTNFFVGVLGCTTPTIVQPGGGTETILVFELPGGGSISVEFTDEGGRENRSSVWLELASVDHRALRASVENAGYELVDYPGPSDVFYFAAPGGYVMRLVPG